MTGVAAMVRPRHWALALACALLLHAGLALAFVSHRFVDGGAAAGAGIGGIEIGLPPAGAAPGGAAAAAVPEAAAVPVAEAATVPSASADPRGAVPLYSPVEPEPVEVEAVEVQPVEPEPVVAEPAMELPSPPKAKPWPSVSEAPPAAELAEVTTNPLRAEATTAALAPDHGAADEPRGNGGKSGTGERGATGTAAGHSGGGMPGAFIDYKARLQAWLEKHKEYPRRARLRRQEGTAKLYVAFDRHGIVVEYRILESSGYKLLDEEVVAMIKRASPLPAPPAAMPGDRVDYVVPVEFFQR